MEPSSPERKPFREWGIGTGVSALVIIISLFSLALSSVLSLLLVSALLVWGIYMAVKGRILILIGIISAPVILAFVGFIVCGGFILFSS